MEYRRQLPVEIKWTEEEQATIDIICDACEKRYIILTNEYEWLQFVPFVDIILEVH